MKREKIGNAFYEYVGISAYENKAGEMISLHKWKARCAECDVSFSVMDKARKPKHLSRRCAKHKRPGKRA